jgi:hypothetical protein
MSGSHHHRHHRRNPVKRFFDRLLGKRRHESHHASRYPGIHLPQDSIQVPETSGEPEITQKEAVPTPSRPLYQPIPLKHRSRKPSFSARFSRYFKEREFRKDERRKERYQRKMHRKHLVKHRKEEAGRSVSKKLFSWVEEGEAEASRKHSIFSKHSPVYRNMTIIVNSTILYISTYIIVYLLYWMVVLLTASLFGLDSSLFFYDLKFNDHSPLWTRFNILVVTGSGPFFCLALGLLLHRKIFKLHRFVGLRKLFILWMAFHALNHFFGAFTSGVVTDEGFGYVAAWLYMNTAVKFLFSLVSLFLLGLIGFFSAEYILETSDSSTRIKTENRTAFIFQQALFPALIGTTLLLLLRIPKNFDYPYESLMLFSIFFMVIPAFFNKKVKPSLNMLKLKKKRSIHLGYLAMLMILLAFFRIMLDIGLHFIIKIQVSISPATI